MYDFNSHAHVERDHIFTRKQNFNKNFNSHAHVERDHPMQPFTKTHINFNSHAHVERDWEDFDFTLNKLNFNSHAHVERDMCGTNFGGGAKISTHTLTWSVTLDVVHIWCLLNVMRTYFFI